MSNKEFYVGQEVVCVEPAFSYGLLLLQKHYIVDIAINSWVKLDGVENKWDKTRFEDAKEWASHQNPYGKDWTENKGYCPVEDDVLVDVRFADGEDCIAQIAGNQLWVESLEIWDITHWRLHKVEQPIKEEESFKGLENAYDEYEPEGSPMPAELFTPAINYMPGDKVIYKYPETSYVPPENIPVKRSKHSIAAEVYELITGKSLTEDDVSDIVAVLQLIERMEK